MAVLYPGPKPPKAPTPGTIPGLIEFYHGTTRANADKLVSETIGVYSVSTARLLDDSEYTDFGKGFYIHPPENRKLAIDWAKNHASKTGGEWGVLVVRLTQAEFDGVGGQILHFRTKRSDRPHNAPVLGAGRVQRRAALRLASSRVAAADADDSRRRDGRLGARRALQLDRVRRVQPPRPPVDRAAEGQ
jgi:hypothetical protein